MAEQRNNNFSENREEYVESFWKYFMYYIENLQSTLGKNNFDVQKELEKDIKNFTIFLTECSPMKSNYIRLLSQKFFAKNPLVLLETYKEIINESQKDPNYLLSFNSYTYPYNKDSFRTQFIAEVLIDTRKANPNLTPGTKEEFKILQQNLAKCDKLFEKRLKRLYIQLLVQLGDFLKKFNLIEYSTTTFRHKLAHHSLVNLSYPAHDSEIDKLKEQEKKDPKNNDSKENDLTKTISIDTLFTENYLNSLTLPKLMTLSAFWINRTTKHIVTLNEMLFIVNELNLWETISPKQKRLNLDSSKLSTLLIKTQYLSNLEDEIFDILENLQFKFPHLTQKQLNAIFSHHFDEKIAKEETAYKHDFDKLLPTSPNKLSHDLLEFHQMSNTRYLLYRLKDICIFDLLMGCIDEGYSKNWGVVPNTTQKNSKFITVYFDISGLNMPLRLHVYKSELIDFLKAYTGEPKIPLYKGAKDIDLGKKFFSTTVLAPISKKQNTCVKKKLSDPTKLPQTTIAFLRHIRFLKEPSQLPPSLKVENPNAPNAINLETGEKLHIKFNEHAK